MHKSVGPFDFVRKKRNCQRAIKDQFDNFNNKKNIKLTQSHTLPNF